MRWQPLPPSQSGPEDERLIATGGDDCAILIWNARKPESKAKCFFTMDSPIVRLAFTPDGAFIAGATATQILIWKVGSHAVPRASWSRPANSGWLSPKTNIESDEEDEHCLCWDADGQKLAYGSNSRVRRQSSFELVYPPNICANSSLACSHQLQQVANFLAREYSWLTTVYARVSPGPAGSQMTCKDMNDSIDRTSTNRNFLYKSYTLLSLRCGFKMHISLRGLALPHSFSCIPPAGGDVRHFFLGAWGKLVDTISLDERYGLEDIGVQCSVSALGRGLWVYVFWNPSSRRGAYSLVDLFFLAGLSVYVRTHRRDILWMVVFTHFLFFLYV